MKTLYNHIKQINVSYYGNSLLNSNAEGSQHIPELINIPGEFEYNSSWKIIYTCNYCNQKVEFFEDFDNEKRNFKWLSRLNSKNSSDVLLTEVCKAFSRLELIEISGVKYINRCDFNYESEFQRKSSVNLLLSSCPTCGAVYLGDFKVGYPILPESNNPKGKIGKVRIEGLVGLDQNWIEYKYLSQKLDRP